MNWFPLSWTTEARRPPDRPNVSSTPDNYANDARERQLISRWRISIVVESAVLSSSRNSRWTRASAAASRKEKKKRNLSSANIYSLLFLSTRETTIYGNNLRSKSRSDRSSSWFTRMCSVPQCVQRNAEENPSI